MNRDPIGYLGGFNLYEYVKGMPKNWLDPLGQFGSPIGIPVPKPSPVTGKYCKSASENPQNGWLECACEVSQEIDMAIDILGIFPWYIDNAGDKAKWFKCTRKCMSDRWEEAMDSQEGEGSPSEGSEWGEWCDDCDANGGSKSCCEKQVEAEQSSTTRLHAKMWEVEIWKYFSNR